MAGGGDEVSGGKVDGWGIRQKGITDLEARHGAGFFGLSLDETGTGYTLEAQFDVAQLGLTKLAVGQQLRGDFGVLFSDKGGALTLTRAMWADNHPEVSVNNDIPTESRIHPKRWGWLVIR